MFKSLSWKSLVWPSVFIGMLIAFYAVSNELKEQVAINSQEISELDTLVWEHRFGHDADTSLEAFDKAQSALCRLDKIETDIKGMTDNFYDVYFDHYAVAMRSGLDSETLRQLEAEVFTLKNELNTLKHGSGNYQYPEFMSDETILDNYWTNME